MVMGFFEANGLSGTALEPPNPVAASGASRLARRVNRAISTASTPLFHDAAPTLAVPLPHQSDMQCLRLALSGDSHTDAPDAYGWSGTDGPADEGRAVRHQPRIGSRVEPA